MAASGEEVWVSGGVVYGLIAMEPSPHDDDASVACGTAQRPVHPHGSAREGEGPTGGPTGVLARFRGTGDADAASGVLTFPSDEAQPTDCRSSTPPPPALRQPLDAARHHHPSSPPVTQCFTARRSAPCSPSRVHLSRPVSTVWRGKNGLPTPRRVTTSGSPYNDFDIILPYFLRPLPPAPLPWCHVAWSTSHCSLFVLIGVLSALLYPNWGRLQDVPSDVVEIKGLNTLDEYRRVTRVRHPVDLPGLLL